jgi:hypothetical protein
MHIGGLERITLAGKDAMGRFLVKLSRNFINTNRHYPSVDSTFFGRILKSAFPNVEWQMHHVWVQQAWSRAGSSAQLFDDIAANEGLRRMGNGLWNLLPIPSTLNNALGRSPVGTQVFATAFYSFIAFGEYHTFDLFFGDD